MATEKTDSLGISDKENLQIQALTLGATGEDVASLSHQSIDEIPQMIASSGGGSLYENQDFSQDESVYTPDKAPMPSHEAARKSTYASLARDADITQDYTGMYDQFTDGGSSSLYDSIKQEILNTSSSQLRGYIQDASQEGDVQGTQALLQASDTLIRQDSNVANKGLETASDLYTESQGGLSVRESQKRFLKALSGKTDESGISVSDRVNHLIDSAIATNTGNLAGYAIDNLEAGFVGEQALGLSKVGKDILGERYLVRGGTMLKDLAQHLRNTPAENQEAEAKKIVDSFVKNSGIIGGNDVVKTFALESFREFFNTPGGDIPFDRWVQDVVGTVELAGLAPVAKIITKLSAIKKSSSSVLRAAKTKPGLVEANPDLDAVLDAAAIKDPAVAQQLGTNTAEVMAKALPTNHIDDAFVLEGASEDLVNKVKGLRTKAEEAENTIDNTFMYRTQDYANKQKTILDVFSQEKFFGNARPSISTLKRSEDRNSMTLHAMYGVDTNMPLSLGQAKKLQNNLNKVIEGGDFENTDVQLMVKDHATDTYERFDRNVHGTEGQMYVQLKTDARMSVADVVGTDPLSESGTRAVGSIAGTFIGRAFFDPQDYVDRTLLGSARVGLDGKGLKRHQMMAVASDFLNLGYKGKKKVSNALVQGDQDQVVYSYKELGDLGLSEKEMLGYFSARYLNDVTYNIKNSEKRAQLQRDGYRGFSAPTIDDTVFSSAVKDVEDSEILKNANTVFDPYTGDAVAIDFDTLRDMKEQGLNVKRLVKRTDINGELFTYVVTREKDIHNLPQRVLAHREGYTMRVNKEPYYIDETTNRIIDGKKVEHTGTVGVARSAREARDFSDKLAALHPASRYTSRLDRNIDNGDSLLENDLNTLDGTGSQFWFSGRGQPLRTIKDEIGAIEDPVSAINKLSASVSNVVTHGELLETSLARHRKTYANVQGTDGNPLWSNTDGTWRFDVERAKTIGNDEAAAAVAEYKYLEDLKYTPTNVDKAWRQILSAIDMNMASAPAIVSRASTEIVKRLATTSPGQAARAITFAMTIPLRPFRHIALQSTTGATLFGIDPSITVSSFRDANLMMLGMASYQNPRNFSYVKGLAKSFGHSEKEYLDMFESFRSSGKPFSIDSNIAIGEANFSWARSMPDNQVERVLTGAINTLKSPITIGKAIGFDTGELANQAVTYLFAYKKWQKDNPGVKMTQRVRDEITASARNYSVDMTRTSAFSYQKGALAAATQFMAINHKMALKILGRDKDIGVAGSMAHARYVTGLMAMYGASGVGAGQAYDAWIKESGIQVPKPLDNALHSGFISFFLNSSLDVAFGREWGTNRLDVGSSLSPGNAAFTFMPDFVANLMDSNLVEAFGGPSAQVIPNVFNAHKEVAEMWAIRDDLNTPEKILKSYQVAISQFGSFSDAYKFNLAMAYNDRMGKMMTIGKDGRPTTVANTWEEVFTKSLLGIGTRGESELYNTHLETYRSLNTTSKKTKTDFDKDVDALTKYMYRTFLDYEDPIERVERQQAIAFALHGGDKSRGLLVLKEAQKKFRADPNFDRFGADLAQRYSLLDKDADLRKMKNAISASDAVEEDDKATLIEYIDALEASAAASTKLIDENY